MYLMSIFHGDLKDKCMRTYKRATCETGLYQHQPLQFNSTAWQSSATISTWWRLLLMGLQLMQELCRHLRNAWGSERDAYKTEAAAVFHNQFPVISINPLPHPMSFSHSLVWPETPSAHYVPDKLGMRVTKTRDVAYPRLDPSPSFHHDKMYLSEEIWTPRIGCFVTTELPKIVPNR